MGAKLGKQAKEDLLILSCKRLANKLVDQRKGPYRSNDVLRRDLRRALDSVINQSLVIRDMEND